MLEDILKSINSNLERIAIAIEGKPSVAIGLDVGQGSDTHIAETQQVETQLPQLPQTPVLVADPNAGAVQIPQLAQGGITPQPTMSQAVSPAITQSIPTAQVQESFTFDQLALAMSNAVSAGKMNVIQGILQQLGVQALTQVSPADYNKLATMLKEAGVEV